MKKITLTLSVFVLLLTTNSCGKDFLNTFPTNRASADEIMSTVDGAMLIINGIHRLMYVTIEANTSSAVSSTTTSVGAGHGIGSMWLTMDHLGDDFVLWTRPASWFGGMYDWVDPTRPTSSMIAFPYAWCYQIVGNANAIINRIDEIQDGTQNQINYILGQALVYRAFGHFWATQIWGHRYVRGEANDRPNSGIQLITDIDFVSRPRATVAQVYKQINEDLDEAIRLLSGNPNATGRANKSHINANVAHGIKARVALVQQNYPLAAHHAREALVGIPLANAEELLNGFHTVEAREWIWGSHHSLDQASSASFATFMAINNFASPSIVRTEPRLVNRELYDGMDENDIRRGWWISDSLNPLYAPLLGDGWTPMGIRRYANTKFRAGGGWQRSAGVMVDMPLMRGSEMWLIIAEAEARSGNFAEAREALTTVMNVRVPRFTTTATGSALIREIMDNRRIELWGEGHRWLDLKRLGEGMYRTPAQGHLESLTGNTFNVRVPASDPRWNLVLPQRTIDASRGQLVQNL